MEILIDGSITPKSKDNIICPCCRSVLEYGEKDLIYDEPNDSLYVICPICKNNISIDTDNERELTLENVRYPTDFDNCSVDFGAVDVDNERVNQEIQRLVEKLKYLEKDGTTNYVHSAFGNLFIIIFDDDFMDEYRIIVAKNYHEISIFK